MSPLMMTLAIAWGVVTTVMIVLLIYRSTLTMHEDDQLFLDEAESHMRDEQLEIARKMDRIQPILRVCMVGSGVLAVLIIGMFLWQGYNSIN